MTQLSSCTCFVGDDAYEIVYSTAEVQSIIKYREGRDGRGEVVDYDTLPYYVQLAIYRKLKHVIEKQREALDPPRNDYRESDQSSQ